MTRGEILIAVNFLLLVGLFAYVISGGRQEKKAYVLNQKVFSEFKGTLLLEQKLHTLKSHHQQQLDSLADLYQRNPSAASENAYGNLFRNYAETEEELSNRYTVDIWKQINQYITEYGRQHDYDFIFGASGDGSLMFAKDANNITEDVVLYINQKYEGR